MRTINIHQVDAFTGTIFGGNPAGIVTNAELLSNEEMASIAREMNLSETAFVLPPTASDADIKLRYFTPAVEVDFCGHATVATLYELSRLNKYSLATPGSNTIRVETGAGVLDMAVTCAPNQQPRISFTAPPVQLEEYQLQNEAFAKAFGMPTDALQPDQPILIDPVLKYIYIPVRSREHLGNLTFDLDMIKREFAKDNIVVFCLYTNQPFNDTSDLLTRVTCPLIGLAEDPFTGSIQSGLIHAAKQTKLLAHGAATITVEQGAFMGRPGKATVTHELATDKVTVHAEAAQVFSTTLELA